MVVVHFDSGNAVMCQYPIYKNCDIPSLYCWCFIIISLRPPVSGDHSQHQSENQIKSFSQMDQQASFVSLLVIMC